MKLIVLRIIYTVLITISLGYSQRLIPIDPHVGSGSCVAQAVSRDGRVIVGWSQVENSEFRRAVLWTSPTQVRDLGTLGGNESEATAVSANGEVVVGWSYDTVGRKIAFRWTSVTGMQPLGTLGGTWSYATDVSDDGQTVVGVSQDHLPREQAFVWTPQQGMQYVPEIRNYYSTRANAVSADGSVIVGQANNYAFRWSVQSSRELYLYNATSTDVTADGTVVVGNNFGHPNGDRGFYRVIGGAPQHLASGTTRNNVYSITEDGTVLVGVATNSHMDDGQACYWDGNRQVSLLSHPPGFSRVRSKALGVSGNGRVIVGSLSDGTLYRRAFMWTPEHGMKLLLGLGSRPMQPLAISANGRAVVGTLYDFTRYASIWRAGEGTHPIPLVDNQFSKAYDVSSSGDRVVGEVKLLSGAIRAFVWESGTGSQDIGDLGGGQSAAYGVSADGVTVVGWSMNSQGREEAFRWQADVGIQALGTLTGSLRSEAWAASADGRIIVGRAYNSYRGGDFNGWRNGYTDFGRSRAFHWTTDLGLQSLHPEPYTESYALSVSNDGGTVVGGTVLFVDEHKQGNYWNYWYAGLWASDLTFRSIYGSFSSAIASSGDGAVLIGLSLAENYPAIWSAQEGWRDLNLVYGSLLPHSYRYRSAYDMSPNGKYLLVRVYEGDYRFVYDCILEVRRDGDLNADGCVDSEDLLFLLSEFGKGNFVSRADDNGDGIVDDKDLLILLFNLGSGCDGKLH